jgi:6-phospho-beta-glucosidase
MPGLKAAIIGAGSTYTPELIEGLINRRDTFPVREIALMDIDSRKLGIVGSLAKRMTEHAGMEGKTVLTEDYDEALAGADFVFVQIRVGRLPARVLDEKIPLKYGLIGQETTGIGGFFKGLRTVPVMLDIAKRMERLCPNAWLINFSNPSSICAQALLKYGKIKTIGLCNAPIGLINNPLNALGLPKDAEVDYIGLNHLSFVTGIRHNGRDYVKEAMDGNDELYNKLVGEEMRETARIAGGLPSYYLTYFFHPREQVAKLKKAKLTRGEDCMVIEEELLEMYQDTGLYVKPALLAKRGGAMYSEAACSLAESIYRDTNDIHVVNTLNNGAMPFLADDDVVETRAYINAKGAKTIPAVELGNHYLRGLVQAVKAYERLAVNAAVNGCRTEALRALMVHPLIGDYQTAADCFDEMLLAHKAYLPAFFKA